MTGLPWIENYVLSMHARNIPIWAVEHNEMPWLGIEKALCKPFSPINVLDRKSRELPLIIKDKTMMSGYMDTNTFSLTHTHIQGRAG